MDNPPPAMSGSVAEGQRLPDSPRRGQGRYQQHFESNRRGYGSRGDRGGRRGRGRGRGDFNGTTFAPALNQIQASGAADQNTDNYVNPALAGSTDKSPREDSVNQTQPAEDKEVCFICASSIDHVAITPCNHQTCHICALRLRALYKKRDCAYCKTEAPYVIFTDHASKRYEDFIDSELVRTDEVLGIKYEKPEIFEDTVLLLRYNCPDNDCDIACLRWPDLFRHVKTKHGKLMCNLCTRNKKVFTHEHELLTAGELRRHEKFGDDNPGAIDQSGFKGHPECGFCRERFYGDDELYTHCREKHERCHICDRRNPGSQVQYYLNYEALEKHFAEAHFVCFDAECLANKTNVFEAELDLKAHQLQSHPYGMTKDVRRDARLVNISGFDYRTPYQPARRGERGNRGNGRGADPNTDPLPVSSAQPMRRDELAYQRQMAILNAQPQAITRNHAASPVPRPMPPPIQQTSITSPPPNPLSFEDQNPNPNRIQTPQEQARQIRHNSVLERASTLLKADNAKLSVFRSHVSSYRASNITASALVESLISLLSNPTADIGKLVRELADIYEDENKRTSLLQAWNDWLSINAESDYPSLPPGTEDTPGPVQTGGRRVLRLKSSTAPSSRSSVSRQGSWGNAVALGKNNVVAPLSHLTSSTSPFPALGGASSLANGQKRAAWTTSSSGTNNQAPSMSARIGHQNNPRPVPSSAKAVGTDEAFPALPVGKKPMTLMAGLNRGAVRWDDGRAKVENAWGTGPQESEAATSEDRPAEKSGKRGKKGKQVLYKFG